jgi:hypothetical protein
MNYFVLIGGILWLGGAVQYYWHNNYRMAIVSIAYACAQFALVNAK